MGMKKDNLYTYCIPFKGYPVMHTIWLLDGLVATIDQKYFWGESVIVWSILLVLRTYFEASTSVPKFNFINISYVCTKLAVCQKTLIGKYEINHTGDGQTEGRKKTVILMEKMYEFIRSNVVTFCVTERWTLMTGVIIDTLWQALTFVYPWYKPTYLYVDTGISLLLNYEGMHVTQGYVWYNRKSWYLKQFWYKGTKT